MSTPTKAFTGKGTILSIGSGGAPETFTPVLQVKQWSFSGLSAKYDDVTNGDSPTSGAATVEEAIPSTISPGTLTLSGIFLPTDPGQTSLASAFASQDLTDFQLQLPLAPGQTTKGNMYALVGYVQDMPLPDTIDYSKSMTFKVAIKLNALPVLTPGS